MKTNTEIDWDAFKEGHDKCEELDSNIEKAENPYLKNTIEWKSWNRGWNSNFYTIE